MSSETGGLTRPFARLRGVMPRALAPLLLVVAIVGLCWTFVVPPFQGPDELDQYAYVESIATNLRIPSTGRGHALYSTDEATAAAVTGAALSAFTPQAAPPPWSSGLQRGYRDGRTSGFADRANGGGLSSESGNPPLYYLLASVGYLLDPGGSAYGRLYGIRIEGIFWLLLTALGAWLLAGETFGRRRLIQTVVAATTALLPMVAFMSTNVNADALIITEWTFAFWLMARVVNRSSSWSDLLGLYVLIAVAILTKAISYALIPSAFLAIAIGIRRRPAGVRLRTLRRSGTLSLAAFVPVVLWLLLSRSLGGVAVTMVSTTGHPFNVSEFLSYVWQFYLPRLWFMTKLHFYPGTPLDQVWLNEGAGRFGWLSVNLPSWMLLLAKILIGVVSAMTVTTLTRLRTRSHLALVAVYGIAFICLLGVLHITDYRTWLVSGGAFLQGRYILPVASLLGLAVGLVLSRLSSSMRTVSAGLIVFGLLAGQVLSLATVVHAYYI